MLKVLTLFVAYINGLMQKRSTGNSIANALELRLSCTDPSTCLLTWLQWVNTTVALPLEETYNVLHVLVLYSYYPA